MEWRRASRATAPGPPGWRAQALHCLRAPLAAPPETERIERVRLASLTGLLQYRATMSTERIRRATPQLDPHTRVQYINGVGPQRALAFERLGVVTLEQLVRHYPRTWLDASRFVKVRDLAPGELLTVVGAVKHAAAHRTRGGRTDFAATVSDGTGTLPCYFFGQSWLSRTL